MQPVPTYVRQLAAELEMLAHGSTASWNPAGGNGVPDSRAPTGDANPPHLQFLADWDRGGDAVLERWLAELKRWKGGGMARPEGKSEREIVLDAGEGYGAKDVADRFRLTPTMVRRWRVQDGRDGETGVPLARLKAKVTELRGEGKSYRAIGEALGRSKSQVERVDKAA